METRYLTDSNEELLVLLCTAHFVQVIEHGARLAASTERGCLDLIEARV
jgi:hypothetical protein